MARIKYYYDTESCKYERIRVSGWDIFTNLIGFLALALTLATGIVLVYMSYFESPKEALLRKENEELQFHYDMMSEEMDKANKMLAVLQERDDEVYRTIFETDPLPASIRNAGVGGVDRYKELLDENLEREELVVGMYQKIDQLKKKMYIQTKSYDEIMNLARNKADMMASIPAIQPIQDKELKRFASGYGMRMHPILKVWKMHYGVDYSAEIGTPIYATGNGKVTYARNSFGPSGKMVVIDHGYGFKSVYLHLHDFNIKQGQNVKRGDCIGYVGKTGRVTAPHLHYEIRKDGQAINPVHYFYQDLSDEEYEKLLQLASEENQSLG